MRFIPSLTESTDRPNPDGLTPLHAGIRVYIRTLSAQGDVILLPMWRLNNHQSMRWRRAQVLLNHPALLAQKEAIYQVVVEGVWGDARVGAIALDDITFFEVAPDSELCKSTGCCPLSSVTRTSLHRGRNRN